LLNINLKHTVVKWLSYFLLVLFITGSIIIFTVENNLVAIIAVFFITLFFALYFKVNDKKANTPIVLVIKIMICLIFVLSLGCGFIRDLLIETIASALLANLFLYIFLDRIYKYIQHKEDIRLIKKAYKINRNFYGAKF